MGWKVLGKMAAILGLIATPAAATGSILILIDFKPPTGAVAWFPLTDQVRGGRSTIFMSMTPHATAEFVGDLTLIDNAGFASFRAQRSDHSPWDFGPAQVLLVDARGDGRTYKILLKDAAALHSDREYSWEASFQSRPAFSESVLPLASFRPVARGRVIGGVPPLDSRHIFQIGIQLNDKIPGAFRIELRSIQAAY